MTYSGGQRGKAKPRSERESPIQSLLNVMFPTGTGRPAMDRRTATQKYADAVAAEQQPMYGSLPVDYKATEQTAGQTYGGLPADYKATEQQAGLEAERFRRGAGFPGQTSQVYPVTPIVTGLTPTGEVDRTQSDEYKATRARYDQLRKAGPEMVMTPEGLRKKAVDYGLQEWAKMYPQLAARQQQGSFNPLMQETFDYQTGEGPGQLPAGMAPDQETVMGDLGSRAQGEGGYDYEALMAERAQRDMQSPNPLAQQEMQQQATAAQANQGMQEKESVLKKTDAFLNPYYNRMF